MRICVIAVGRLRDAAVAALVERYSSRLPRGVRIEWLEVPGATGKMSADQARAREAERIRARIPDRARVAALAERGKQMDSREFAAWLAGLRDRGLDLCFLIGGAGGLDDSLVREAHETIALSRLTYPHELVRAILAEQLYRGFSILGGEPYHRD